MSANLLIIEDEALAAQALAQLLRELAPELHQEPPLATVAAALARLTVPPAPALVMLDVQLADGLCFELFDALRREPAPDIGDHVRRPGVVVDADLAEGR